MSKVQREVYRGGKPNVNKPEGGGFFKKLLRNNNKEEKREEGKTNELIHGGAGTGTQNLLPNKTMDIARENQNNVLVYSYCANVTRRREGYRRSILAPTRSKKGKICQSLGLKKQRRCVKKKGRAMTFKG